MKSCLNMEFLLFLLPAAAAAFYLLPHASLRTSKDGIIMCGLVGKREHATDQRLVTWSSLMSNDLVLCGKTRKTCNPLELPT